MSNPSECCGEFTQPVAVGGSGGIGDVVGPASSTAGNLPTFADTTGKLLQDSGIASSTLQLFSPLTNQILLSAPLPALPTTLGPISGAGAIGTPTARTPDNTSYGSRKLRVGYVSAAGASSVAMVLFYSAYASNQGYFSRETGFALKSGTLLSAVSSSYAWMLGLGTVNDFSMTPSNRPNTVLVGADAGDTNAQVMYNDGSGSCTKVDLGANFPARTVGDFYDLLLWCLPGSATISYTVNRHSSAGALFSASGEVTGANTPAAGAQWYVMTGCNNGAAGGAVSVDTTGFICAVPL